MSAFTEDVIFVRNAQMCCRSRCFMLQHNSCFPEFLNWLYKQYCCRLCSTVPLQSFWLIMCDY